jgi:polyisoprenoid-binding protein YceI
VSQPSRASRQISSGSEGARSDKEKPNANFPRNTTGTDIYTLDPAHSSVEFSVKHLGITNTRGTFDEFEGTLEFGQSLADAQAYGTVVAASVNTNLPQRDEHLRSSDFFDAEEHPRIEFHSTEIRPVDDETFTIVGELTMRGVTRSIELEAEIDGTEVDPWGNERVGLEVTGQLNRSDWDMKFNQVLGSGNVAISDEVKLRLDISAVKQQSAEIRPAA